MGSLDTRYAITHRRLWDKVAALVTISTPHKGISIADVAVRLIKVTSTDEIVNFVLSLAGGAMDQQNFLNCKQNILKAAEQLTTKYTTEISNPIMPDEDLEFHKRVRGFYIELSRSSDNVAIVNVSGDIFSVLNDIISKLYKFSREKFT